MTKSFITSGTKVGLLLWNSCYIIWIMIQIFVTLKKLLLAESLIAMLALKRLKKNVKFSLYFHSIKFQFVYLLICVNQHVRLQMTSRDRRIRTNFALVAFFAFVCLCVNLIAVAIRKSLTTALAFNWNIRSMKLLNVNPKISFPSACCWTQFTLKNWFISHRMYQLMSFQGVGLCKFGITDVADVWLFTL